MRKNTNVIIIMADQLRYDVMNLGITPHLQMLAEEGVQFTNCYCACPLCVPERGAFFTGTYPNNNGSLINPWADIDKPFGYVKKEMDNLYTLMEEEWESIHSGKQHLLTEGEALEHRSENKTLWAATDEIYFKYLADSGKRKPGGPKFRTLVPEMREGHFTKAVSYSTPATGCYEPGYESFYDGFYTEEGLKALKARTGNKPLLLNMMYLAPHPPFDIPEPWYSKFTTADLPENVGVWYDRQSPLQLYNLTGVVGSHYDREEWKEPWRVYLGLVSLLDDCVGKIIKELKEQGIYEDSLIIFTSDHGEMLGSHRLFQKMCMYEESVKIPLYMKFPKDQHMSRQVFDDTISGIDVFPTLCEYLNLKPGHIVDGQSLLPLIEGREKEFIRKEAYIQFDGNGARSNFQRCVVQDGYKLIVDMFKDETYLELYHVEKDPSEKVNLLFQKEYDTCAEKLLHLLKNHMKQTGDRLTIGEICLEKFRETYNRG